MHAASMCHRRRGVSSNLTFSLGGLFLRLVVVLLRSLDAVQTLDFNGTTVGQSNCGVVDTWGLAGALFKVKLEAKPIHRRSLLVMNIWVTTRCAIHPEVGTILHTTPGTHSQHQHNPHHQKRYVYTMHSKTSKGSTVSKE